MAIYTAHTLPLRDIEPLIYSRSGKKGKYTDNIIVLDVEDTSYFLDESGIPVMFDPIKPGISRDYRKGALLYHWQASIDGCEFSGRDLDSLSQWLKDLSVWAGDSIKIIYVHNLSHEFQFLLNLFEPSKVFARRSHNPIYVDVGCNLQFRCSYQLTHLSLAAWADSIGMAKLKGALDYHKLRTPLTPLTPLEIWYCMEDIRIMVKGLQQYRSRWEHVREIPLTQTGELRRVVQPLLNWPAWNWRVTKLTPPTMSDHLWMLNAFFGGTVIASTLHREVTITDPMWMYDISSSYPWVLISERYPLTPFETAHSSKLIKRYMSSDDYTYIIEIRCYGVKALTPLLFMSASKIRAGRKVFSSNGRVKDADYFEVTLTKPDYEIFRQCYRCEKITVITCKVSKLQYLPADLRLLIIDLYKSKTMYKDVSGFEELYVTSKQRINSMFGLCVFKEFADDVEYIGDDIKTVNGVDYQYWAPKPLDSDGYTEKLKRKVSRWHLPKNYLALQFGLFCTAYARANLWRGCLQTDENHIHQNATYVVYCDTDSNKCIDHPGMREWYDKYNAEVLQRHKQIAADLNIDPADLSPLDPKGRPHPIGVYACENPKDKKTGELLPIREFRTLGSKEYVYRDPSDGELKMTVAGVSKKAVKCLHNDINNFRKDFTFSELELRRAGAEKLIPYYLSDIDPVVFPDGYRQRWRYGVHLMETTFELDTPIEAFIAAAMQMHRETPEWARKLKGGSIQYG